MKTGAKRTKLVEVPEFSSMNQMSAACGIPMSILRQAKKDGCMFVVHGRCDLIRFLTWFFDRKIGGDGAGEKSMDIAHWANRDKRAVALMRERDLLEANKMTIKFDDAAKFLRYVTGVSFFGELDRIAEEFPASMKGKGEMEIHEECLRQVALIKKTIESNVDSWVKKKGRE